MEIHIGDFCTERKNVHPLCPQCTQTVKQNGVPEDIKVFKDYITRVGPDGQVDGGKKGEEVYIFCSDHGAYDIHLN
jgi:hypothetical protein